MSEGLSKARRRMEELRDALLKAVPKERRSLSQRVVNSLPPPPARLEGAEPPNRSMTPWGAMTQEKIKGARSATPLYRAYKHTPHSPRSLALKYIVHRIENVGKYEKAGVDESDAMDRRFMELHQQGKAAKKNAHITALDLHQYIRENPHLVAGVLRHRDELGKTLRSLYPDRIHMIDGEPHVALSRGLNTSTHGEDHALASYADDPVRARGFGSHQYHYMVPLKNVWYSFDHGPVRATSGAFGNEDEFLVSPHPRRPASEEQVKKLGKDVHAYVHDENLDRAFRSDKLRASAVRHPGLSHVRMFQALEDPNPWVGRNLMGNPAVPGAVLTAAVRSRDVGTANRAMDHPNASRSHLQEALKHPSEQVRAHAVSSNKATFQDLKDAERDPHPMVRRAVVENTKDPDQLHRLSGDPDEDVRWAVANKGELRPETVDRLAQDEDVDVRSAALRDEKVSPEVLSHALRNEKNMYILGLAANHPKATSPDDLRAALRNAEEAQDKALTVNDQYVTARTVGDILNRLSYLGHDAS